VRWTLALRDRRARAGLLILLGLVVVAALAPALAPFDPLAQPDVVRSRFLAPLQSVNESGTHWMGTDQLGRDLLSRVIYGARISLAVGLLAVAVSLVLGGLVGFVAAAAGGTVDRVLMAATDTALMFPRIVLLLSLVSLWQPSLALVVLVLGFTGWMGIARLARAEARGVLARPFVEAARSSGVSPARLLWRHVVPNSLAPLLVAGALGVGNAITLEAGLAFLGMGVPAPAPSWGNMISAGRDVLINAPWVATFPGLAIVLAVIGCNLLADGLRDGLDPTSREGAQEGRGKTPAR
jgi:peptide/nickel transport system permease protein